MQIQHSSGPIAEVSNFYQQQGLVRCTLVMLHDAQDALPLCASKQCDVTGKFQESISAAKALCVALRLEHSLPAAGARGSGWNVNCPHCDPMRSQRFLPSCKVGACLPAASVYACPFQHWRLLRPPLSTCRSVAALPQSAAWRCQFPVHRSATPNTVWCCCSSRLRSHGGCWHLLKRLPWMSLHSRS